jgi:uncharacterized paraquat-inducible protein A
MQRQNRKSFRNGDRSLGSVLQQREGRPFCAKCQKFVKHKDAVWVGRRQSRCPVCGEMLERRLDTNGQENSTDGLSASPPA